MSSGSATVCHRQWISKPVLQTSSEHPIESFQCIKYIIYYFLHVILYMDRGYKEALDSFTFIKELWEKIPNFFRRKSWNYAGKLKSSSLCLTEDIVIQSIHLNENIFKKNILADRGYRLIQTDSFTCIKDLS